MGFLSRGPLVGFACAILAAAPSLRAADGDGAYGRLSADGSLAGHLGGATVGSRFGAAADLRLRYLEAAGVGVAFTTTADTRVLSIPFELRPLFPIRFLKAQETGHAFADLTLDSIALELGPSWDLSHKHPGLWLGLSVELPLMGSARGLFARIGLGLRFSAEKLEGLESTTQGLLTLGLGWHEPVRLGIADLGDRTHH